MHNIIDNIIEISYFVAAILFIMAGNGEDVLIGESFDRTTRMIF